MNEVLKWLYNPLVLAAIGVACQFVPGIRTFVKNNLVPYLQSLLAWIAAAFGATAAGGPVSDLLIRTGVIHNARLDSHEALAAGIGLGFIGGLGGAIVQAAQAYLVQRMFCWPGRVLPPVPKDSI